MNQIINEKNNQMKRLIFSNGLVHVDAVLPEKQILSFLQKQKQKHVQRKIDGVPEYALKRKNIYYDKNGKRITGSHAKWFASTTKTILLKPNDEIISKYSEYQHKLKYKVIDI